MASPRVGALVALVPLGCGGATVSSYVPDADVDGASSLDAPTVIEDIPAPDVQGADLVAETGVDATLEAAVDASRCDPSVLADAGGVSADGGALTDAPWVVEMSANWILHQCVRMSDGTARCRGFNHRGQLGRGTYSELGSLPSQTVPGLTEVEQVVTHQLDATCTRHRDGTVRCWGSNRYALLGTGHAEDENCRGTSAEPCRTRPMLVPGLTEVIHLAAGPFAFCAVRRDGSVWCWGSVDPLLSDTSPTPVRAPLADVVGLWPRHYGWVVRLRTGRYLTVRAFNGLEIPTDAELDDGLPNGHLCYRLRDRG